MECENPPSSSAHKTWEDCGFCFLSKNKHVNIFPNIAISHKLFFGWDEHRWKHLVRTTCCYLKLLEKNKSHAWFLKQCCYCGVSQRDDVKIPSYRLHFGVSDVSNHFRHTWPVRVLCVECLLEIWGSCWGRECCWLLWQERWGRNLKLINTCCSEPECAGTYWWFLFICVRFWLLIFYSYF